MRGGAFIAALALLVGLPGLAIGDAEEASVHGETMAGLALAGDPLADDETDTIAVGGIGARLSYATSDWFAYEAKLGLWQSGPANFAAVDSGANHGDLERKSRLYRASAGATARLGVRFIPTFHLGAGVQARQFISGYLRDDTGLAIDTVPGELAFDLVITAKLGFDYRINRRLVCGLGVEATHGFGETSFDVIAGAVNLAYYWYPRWF